MRFTRARPLTFAITKGDASPDVFRQKKDEIAAWVQKAVAAGVSLFQIREKHLSARQVFELASAAVRIAAGSRTAILVNDRADVALAAGAGGVHLRSDSIGAKAVRAGFPPEFIIGVSAHSRGDVIRARSDGADFAVLGPIFATPGKTTVIGLDELAGVCGSVGDFPVLAIGGIDSANVQSVLDAGAAGFAAIRFMNSDAGMKFVRESVYEAD